VIAAKPHRREPPRTALEQRLIGERILEMHRRGLGQGTIAARLSLQRRVVTRVLEVDRLERDARVQVGRTATASRDAVHPVPEAAVSDFLSEWGEVKLEALAERLRLDEAATLALCRQRRLEIVDRAGTQWVRGTAKRRRPPA
jgi:hypothetical protein